MQQLNRRYFQKHFLWLLPALLLFGAGVFVLIRHLLKPAPYLVAVIQSHTEVTAAEFGVVKMVIDRRIENLNVQGGINGRPLEVLYLNDQGQKDILEKQITAAAKNPDLIAFVGAQGVWRAQVAGPVITREKLPFIGNYTYTNLVSQYPNMYTYGLGLKEGYIVFRELLKAKAKRVGFIGEKDAPHSRAFLTGLRGLEKENIGFKITFTRFYEKGHRYSEPEIRILADSLRQKVDFLVYTNEVASIYPVLEAFARYQLNFPIYCGLIDIAQLDAENPYFKAVEMYDFNSFGIPGTHNKRLQEKLLLYENAIRPAPQVEYQLGLAANLSDMIGLVAEAAQHPDLPPGTPVRERINAGLKHYLNGKEIFRGWYADLYFTPERASAGNILLAWKPRNRSKTILAPRQYIFQDTALKEAPVLYTNLDMVRIDQVSDEDGAFMATFYLQLQAAEPIDIDQLDFTNADRNAINHEALIEARLLRSRKDTTRFKFYHYLYKISGKFRFDPDLRRYPLDQQSFPISIQASNALKPFLIQPADLASRDTIFTAKGWQYRHQFVGFDQEIISSSNAFSLERKNSPYYKFTFVYVMNRFSMDYFLKTLVPLFTILLIAYFSVYIPPREFEALAGIQVTALLSSIALYFSTYKPQIQYATISDKIFIFSYIMVTTLLGTSILIYIMHRQQNPLKYLARIYQRVLFPIIVIGFSVYIRWF